MSDSRSIIYDFSKLSAKEVEQHREIARQHGDNRTPYFAGETITLQDDDSARQAAETDNSNLRFGQFSAGHYHSLYLSPTGKVAQDQA